MKRTLRDSVAAGTAIWLALAGLATAAEYQWSVPVRSLAHAGESRAFLWIPPSCQRVRAVVLAQHNMEEVSILEHPKFRTALAELGFAEIWCVPPFDHLFRFNEGAGGIFNIMMDALSSESGYDELKFAPIVGIGHSAAASWPYYFAAWNPERTLAAISVSGQWPYFRDPKWAPDIWGDRNIVFIPCLETMGEYESANTWSGEGLKQRRQHPRLPLSMLACPTEGHFATTERKVEYLALYLKKAAQYRLPAEAPTNAAPKLRTIDPTTTGWLADKWRLDRPPTAPAAPVGRYTADPAQAFWFFDEEMARATEKYQAAHRGSKAQLLGFVQDGRIVEQRDTHQQVNLLFQPQADGVTFKLTGAFLDVVPGGSPRPAAWTGLPAGSAIDHATGGGPIIVAQICGPFVKVGPDTFELRFDRSGLGEGRRAPDLWFAATHPGDAIYKPAVQQAQMLGPQRTTDGVDQHIEFRAIRDQQAGAKSVPLEATTDSGEKVRFFVREGPAEVEGDRLRFTAIPKRSRFPIKVTVVAWQFGRAAAPKLNTAEPVERSFLLTR